ncbi:Thiosulfate sulfurtransferase [Zostera marina]|uniref:Sulfurtransferase n=1 Tax=Zostera marina TaxID=29655 RepID=A0A0K9NUI2_ZOSMR|nr:Thiosulfate sulfurtransferase [Zostera marina]
MSSLAFFARRLTSGGIRSVRKISDGYRSLSCNRSTSPRTSAYESKTYGCCTVVTNTVRFRHITVAGFSAFATIPANDPVVSADWLHDNIKDHHIKILDASWYMPDDQRNPFQEFQTAHIPGSLFFDLDGISDRTSNLPHMLPSEEGFSAAVSALGIDNKDGVIIYDGKGIYSAARVWWMFRVFGHNKVWVLDGGLPQWRALGYDVESVSSGDAILKSSAASDVVGNIYQGLSSDYPITFQAKLQRHLVWNFDQIKQNMEEQSHQHLDARSKGRFDGTAAEPRKGLKSGHIPGSKCISFNELLDSSNQTLLLARDISKRFYGGDIRLDGDVVISCGTGVTACIVALGLHRLGKSDVKIYDGSWTEWASKPDTPIATTIQK